MCSFCVSVWGPGIVGTKAGDRDVSVGLMTVLVLVCSLLWETNVVGTNGRACALKTSAGYVGMYASVLLLSVVLIGVVGCACLSVWLASQLFSFLTKLSVIRSRLVLAVCVIGVELIRFFVAAIVDVGIGVGPLAWVGHAGEKWSFTTAQHGHINQWLA